MRHDNISYLILKHGSKEAVIDHWYCLADLYDIEEYAMFAEFMEWYIDEGQ